MSGLLQCSGLSLLTGNTSQTMRRLVWSLRACVLLAEGRGSVVDSCPRQCVYRRGGEGTGGCSSPRTVWSAGSRETDLEAGVAISVSTRQIDVLYETITFPVEFQLGDSVVCFCRRLQHARMCCVGFRAKRKATRPSYRTVGAGMRRSNATALAGTGPAVLSVLVGTPL